MMLDHTDSHLWFQRAGGKNATPPMLDYGANVIHCPEIDVYR